MRFLVQLSRSLHDAVAMSPYVEISELHETFMNPKCTMIASTESIRGGQPYRHR